MNTFMKTWLVLALAIGTAMMASGTEWVDEPLKWNTKGKPAAAVNEARKTVDGGESVASVPEEERFEKEAEEEQPAVPEPQKAPRKKPLWKEGGEKAWEVVKICAVGTVFIILNYPEVLRVLLH